MRSLSAKIVDGKIVTRARLPEGGKVTIFVHDPEDEYELGQEEAEGISRGIEDHRAGRVVSADTLLAFLRRP
jgi:hypothetical protein